MKTPKEIEKLAFDYAYQFRDNDIKIQDANHNGFVEGYNQCQQYMSDEIRRWRGAVEAQERRCKSLRDIIESNADKKYTGEDLRKAFNAGDAWGRADYLGNNQPFDDEDEFINSLNK